MRCNVVGACIRGKINGVPYSTDLAFIKGLRAIGVAVNEVDPAYPNQTFDYGADFTLVFKFLNKYLDEFTKCKNRIIFQPDDPRYEFIKNDMKTMRTYCDYALAYDFESSEMYRNELGYLASERMLLTADPDVYKPIPELKKEFDFCFVGNLSHPENHKSRRRMLEILGGAGYNVVYADHFFDIPRIVEMYNRSKCVINHATDIGQPFGMGWGLQCRLFESGMTKTAFMSNVTYDEGDTLNFYLRFDSEKTLLEQAKLMIEERQGWYSYNFYSEKLYNEIYNFHLPEHRAQQLVNFVENNCG